MRTILKILKIKITTLVVASGFALAAPAHAATFNFSYTLRTGDTLSGMLEGELQDDNDTVFVSAFSGLSFAGNPAPEAIVVQSFTSFLGLSSDPATVSLSGDVMNLLVCPSSNCFENGFFFDTTIIPAAIKVLFPSGVDGLSQTDLAILSAFLPSEFNSVLQSDTFVSDLSAVLSGPGYYAGGSGYGDDVLEVFNAANWSLVEKTEIPTDDADPQVSDSDQPGTDNGGADPETDPEISDSDQPGTDNGGTDPETDPEISNSDQPGTDNGGNEPGAEAVPEPLSLLGTLFATGAGLALRQKRKKSA